MYPDRYSSPRENAEDVLRQSRSRLRTASAHPTVQVHRALSSERAGHIQGIIVLPRPEFHGDPVFCLATPIYATVTERLFVMTATGSDPLVRTQPQARVFLSYSRRDETFVRQLAAALEARGYAVDFDESERDATGLEFGISAQDRWWLRLNEMIAAADVMVFAISPDSIASRMCDDEIAYANSLGKCIIPVLHRAIDYDRAPELVRALNVKLSFESYDQQRSAHATERLCAELDLDLDWHRRAVRLARLAQQWDADSRPPGQPLRAGAIAEADAGCAASEQRPNARPATARVSGSRPFPGGAGSHPAADFGRSGTWKRATNCATWQVTSGQRCGGEWGRRWSLLLGTTR
jgi:hypothetical protein